MNGARIVEAERHAVPLMRALEPTHLDDLYRLQQGEGAFVWGRRGDSGQLWFLEENTGHVNRPFVRENIVCPVPGCSAKLTSAHRARKRDGLQHYSGAGGHSIESIFHSQGCALIEDWLRRRYPKSTVKREEYTNDAGERRADVLITSPGGDRVAFEVQYSALTPDAWQRRHDSYRQQNITDVWLFGHTRQHLKADSLGTFRPNPTHEAVVAAGSPVMFINPESELIGVAVGSDRRFFAEPDQRSADPVSVLDRLRGSSVGVRPLDEFRATTKLGFTSNWLNELHCATSELRSHNADQKIQVLAIEERQRREDAEHLQRLIQRRRPRQHRIRRLLAEPGRWSRSEAVPAIHEYFDVPAWRRIDLQNDAGPEQASFVRWQCVLYFELIAGRSAPFGTKDAYDAIRRGGVRMGQPDAFKLVAKYLYRLEEDEFVSRGPSRGRYPTFIPTVKGAWR